MMLYFLYSCPSKKLQKSFEGDLTSDDVAKYLRKCTCFDVFNTMDIYYSTITLQLYICLL